MRKSEYIRQTALQQPILSKEFIDEITDVWLKYGYDPEYLLDTNDDFHNILADYHLTESELKNLARTPGGNMQIERYKYTVAEDVRTYKALYDRAKEYFCGFYNVPKNTYFSPEEVACYALWDYSILAESRKSSNGYSYYNQRFDCRAEKYKAIMCNVAAFLIAEDVIEYLQGYNSLDILKKRIKKMTSHGIHANEIFDSEQMCYREPKDFDEFAHLIHTEYWFRDKSKGYTPDAKYKWDDSIPSIKQLKDLHLSNR